MKRFTIPVTPSTSSKSVWFPNDVIEDVKLAIRGKDCTFTAFVVKAVRTMLENLKEKKQACITGLFFFL